MHRNTRTAHGRGLMISKADNTRSTIRLGVIGMGARVTHMAKLMCEADAELTIAAVADPQAARVSERAAAAGLRGVDSARQFSTADELLSHADDLDGLVIGTQCHLHAPLAVAAARTGLPLFLEKPVAISAQQLEALAAAFGEHDSSVVVSFPLRLTAHVRTAVDIIQSGRLGAVNQVQAINNVPYGGVYFGQWYRDYEKTGGLWLQKATHDLDYVNVLMSAAGASRPTAVTAMHSRVAMGGTMPANLHCSGCDRTDICPESPQNLLLRGDDGGMLNHTAPTPGADHACAFSDSILHQDAGTAIVMYSSGAHAMYTQNFLPRLSAGFRGATVIGYTATLRFDWQSDIVTVIDHHQNRVDRIEVAAAGMHGGGDAMLARNFVDVLRGRDVSQTPLSAGLTSAAMCLAAREAANVGSTQILGNYGSMQPLIKERRVIEPSIEIAAVAAGA